MSRAVATKARAIVLRTSGSRHGSIIRLMSPGELGELVKPFVFLDLFGFEHPGGGGFGMHPHSGIATLTYLVSGSVNYEDTTGKSGVLPPGGVEWMRAGNGVWHTGGPSGDEPVLGFQLWVVLPASDENGPPESIYLDPSDVPRVGPVRVLLGSFGAAHSPIPQPSSMNYLAVTLKRGERWSYTPPQGHTVGWIAVNAGQLDVGEPVVAGEMLVFEESTDGIEFVATSDASFVLGSAVKHPHDLVMGHYSVHTNAQALAQGEAEIQRIGARLQQEGRIA